MEMSIEFYVFGSKVFSFIKMNKHKIWSNFINPNIFYTYIYFINVIKNYHYIKLFYYKFCFIYNSELNLYWVIIQIFYL